MSLLKRLAGQTVVYGLSSVLGRVLNYLLVPLYTAVFVPAEYGMVTELYAFVAFLNILYTYGLETAYFRFSKGEESEATYQIAFTSILISSVCMSGIIWLFAEPIAVALQYPDAVYVIQWLALILAIDAIVAIPFARLRKQGKAIRFAIFKLTNIAANILLNLFFILWCPVLATHYPESIWYTIHEQDMGVGYVFLSNLLANGLYLFFFLPEWKKTRLFLDAGQWKRMLRYAFPILIIGFAGVTNEMLSRSMLKYRLPEHTYTGLSNQEVLGIFGACYKLAVFMTLTIQAFRYAFEPFFFTQASEKQSPQLFSQVMTGFVLFVSTGWLALCVYMPFYAPLFLRQDSYLLALDAVPWLLGGGLFLGVFYNLSIWYKLTDHTLYGAYISLAGALVTFLLNWSLIPIYGYMGSAVATFVSYFTMVIISFFWGRKHYPIPYEVGKIIGYIALAGSGIVIYSWMTPTWINATAILFIFLTLLSVIERKSILHLIGK